MLGLIFVRGSLVQVHGARLAPGMLVELGWRWRHGPEVVVKVQNAEMQARRCYAVLSCLSVYQCFFDMWQAGLHLGEDA